MDSKSNDEAQRALVGGLLLFLGANSIKFHVCAVCFIISFWASVASADLVDVTTLGIYPDQGTNHSPAINNALRYHKQLYFPPGVYMLDAIVWLRTDRSIIGAGMDETLFVLTSYRTGFRAEGVSNVCFQGFEIYRPVEESSEEMIFVLDSSNVGIVAVRSRENTSRAPSFSFLRTASCWVMGCETIDDQRKIVENGHLQVYGSGITFHTSSGVRIEGNRVVQLTDLLMPDNPYFNYYQAASIQASSCDGVVIRNNYVTRSGNGIDVGSTTNALIEGNVVDNIKQAGIKLVNGSSNQVIRDNFISRIGIAGIWLTPGNQRLGIIDCLVENNTLTRIGEGMGQDWWTGYFSDTVPAGVHLDVGHSEGGQASRSRNNIVRNNVLYNSSNTKAAFIIRSGSYSAINTTMEHNLVLNFPPPAPPTLNPVEYDFCYLPVVAIPEQLGLWIY